MSLEDSIAALAVAVGDHIKNMPKGGSTRPGIVVGKWYPALITHSLNYNLQITKTNELLCHLVEIPEAITLDEIAFTVMTAAAGASAHIGIYSEQDGLPHTLLGGGTVSTATTGEKKLIGLDLALQPGAYFFGQIHTGTPNCLCVAYNEDAMAYQLGVEDLWAYEGPVPYQNVGALPATFSLTGYRTTNNARAALLFYKAK